MTQDRTWTRSLLELSGQLQADARTAAAAGAAIRWHWRQLSSEDLTPGVVVACRQLASGRLEMRLALQGADMDTWLRRRRELERWLGLTGWTRSDQCEHGTWSSLYAEPVDDIADASRRRQASMRAERAAEEAAHPTQETAHV